MKGLLSPRFWGLSQDPASEILRREGAELTRRVAWILLGLDVLMVVLMWGPSQGHRDTLLISTGTLAASLAGCLLLVRAERAKCAAWAMCLGLILASGVAMKAARIVDAGPAVSLLTVIAAAAITLGPVGTLVTSALSVALIIGVTTRAAHGPLDVLDGRGSPWANAAGVGGGMAALGVIMVLMYRTRLQSMDRELAASEERDAARVAFLQAQKLEALGRLAGGIAHDFNNLLGVVRGASDVLRLRGRDPSIAERMFADLDSAVERATLMTERLLAYSRNRSSGKHAADVAALASSLVPLLGRMVGSRIEVILIGAERPLWARIEPTEFEQVLMNLAVNARDAMPGGGLLRVLLEEADEERVVVTVEDTGPGIPHEIRHAVFSPFFSTKEDGTGLGLSTVRDIILGAGGQIELATQIDEGTTFRIFLERASPTELPAPQRAPLGLPAAPGRILVVEDHDLARRCTTQLLEGLGFEVIPVSQGLEALALIDSGMVPDLLVTDNVMPRMDGLELCSRVRERGLTFPIIMVSGDAPPGRDGRPHGSLPDVFLPKPFTIAELSQSLSDVAHLRTDPSRDSLPVSSAEGLPATPALGMGVSPIRH